MIEVDSQPEVEPDRERDGWELVFWMGDAFDYSTPFRAALSEMAEVLSRDLPCSVQLPEYERLEDFVEGRFWFGGKVLRIYYEHSLGYLMLSSDNDDTLRHVAERIRPHLRIVPRP